MHIESAGKLKPGYVAEAPAFGEHATACVRLAMYTEFAVDAAGADQRSVAQSSGARHQLRPSGRNIEFGLQGWCGHFTLNFVEGMNWIF